MTRPILFLHGWTMRGAVFSNVISALEPDFECAAPDLPGHGSNGHLPPNIDACAEMVADIVNAWAGQSPIIVGWSMGAAAAWRYIENFGQKAVGALITIDMSPKVLPSTGWPHGLLGQTRQSVARTSARFETDWEEATEGISRTMFAQPEGAVEFSRNTARDLILSQDQTLMRAFWADLLAMDARPVIPRITIPYLVCSGARSRVYPAAASDWILRKAPNAARHIFESSGHSPHLEEPENFVHTLADFAAGLPDQT